MIDISKLSSHAEISLNKAVDEPSLEKAAEFIKLLDEIENERAATLKLLAEQQEIESRRNEGRRWNVKDTISVITPMLTTIVLAGTLVFQTYSFRQAEQDKIGEVQRQADLAEKTRWTTALKEVSELEKQSTASALLRSFNTEPYKSYARDETVTLLIARESDPAAFKSLFNSTLVPSDWKTLPYILDIHRRLTEQERLLTTKEYIAATRTSDRNRLTKSERERDDALLTELDVTLSGILPVLKSARPADTVLDLRSMSFSNANLSDANLDGANIEDSNFFYTLFENTDLSDVKGFEHSGFTGSIWWHASRISPDLLHYLENNAAYDANEKDYPPTKIVISPAEYQSSIKRLSQPN